MLRRTRVIIMIALMFVVCTITVGAYDTLVKQVIVVDNGVSNIYTTSANTVNEFLTEQNIIVQSYDKVTPSLGSNLTDNTKIDIKRAISVNVTIDGVATKVTTSKSTVGELLEEKHVTLGANDSINFGNSIPIKDNMNIEIKTYEEVMVDGEIEKIEFTTETVENNQLPVGEQKVVQTGVEGQKVKTYKVVYLGGIESRKEFVKETVIKEPINTIIEVGTKQPEPVEVPKQANSSNGTIAGRSYNKVMNLRATAYTPYDGSATGHTAMGTKAHYGVVAVDPRVIPLGTRLYIEGYGEAVAEDTGGAIKGNRIDLCFESYSETVSFGVRYIDVYILD